MTAEGPSLADDEAKLAEYASALADTFAGLAESWFSSLVERRLPGVTADQEIVVRLRDAARETVTTLRAVLALDIAEQRIGPLEVLRRAVTGAPTQVLLDAEVPVAVRDEFARSNFPDDIFDLTPASFADVDPALHEPGLIWGAAKAHVHLRRRREATGA